MNGRLEGRGKEEDVMGKGRSEVLVGWKGYMDMRWSRGWKRRVGIME